MKKSVQLALFAALAAGAGIFAAALVMRGPAGPAQVESGTLLPQPREIAEFSLTDAEGRAFGRAQLNGGWNLLFVGFTQCPDVCPTTLALLKNLVAKLDAQGKPLGVVFVSVDPERDRPEQLANYVHYFNPAFRGVTGQNDELDKLAKSTGFIYVKVPGATPGSYTMDHSSALILVNPQAQVAGYFSPPLNVDALARDLGSVIGKKS